MGHAGDDRQPLEPSGATAARPPARRVDAPAQGRTERTAQIPRSGDRSAAPPRPGPRPGPARVRPEQVAARAPSTGRRYRQTIRRVDLWSVLKVSVCFYMASMAVMLVALVTLWVIGDAAGVVGSVEKFLGDLLQTKDFTFLSRQILQGTVLVGAVVAVLMIVMTVIAAAFYNLFAEILGGIEITITEDESAI
jgi:hypothetical protein